MGVYTNQFLVYGKAISKEEYDFKHFGTNNFYKDINDNYLVTIQDVHITWPTNSSTGDLIENELNQKHFDLNIVKAIYNEFGIELKEKPGFDIYYVYSTFMSYNGTGNISVIKCVDYDKDVDLEANARLTNFMEILKEEVRERKEDQLDNFQEELKELKKSIKAPLKRINELKQLIDNIQK